jgi:APA family basic amino acid/polyamine antiporter
LFPHAFARLNPRGVPAVGVLVSSALASALVLSNYSRSLVQVFTFAILLSTAATLVPYVASSAAWLWRGAGRRSRCVAAAALAFSLYALFGIGSEALVWGTVLIGAGVPLYYLRRWYLRR